MPDLIDPTEQLEEGTFVIIDGGHKDISDPSAEYPLTRIGLMVLGTQIENGGEGPPVYLTPPIGYFKDEVETLMGRNRENIRRLVGVSLPYSPEGIGLRATESSYEEVTDLIRSLREMGYEIILGGPGLTLAPEETMRYFAEHLGELSEGISGIAGDADLLLPEVIKEGSHIYDPRLWRIEEAGAIHHGQMQELSAEEMDQLRKIDHKKFLRGGHPFQLMMEGSSRGCSYRCKMCPSCALSMTPGTRDFTPKNFFERMKDQLSIIGRSLIDLVENDAFAVGMEWWREFEKLIDADPLIRKMVDRMSMSAYMNSHFFERLTSEDVTTLRRCGLSTLVVGVQSTSQLLLRNIARPSVDLDAVIRVGEECQHQGIKARTHMIWGIPGFEDPEIMLQEIQSVCRIADSGLPVKTFQFDWMPGSNLGDRKKGGEFEDYEFSSRDETLVYVLNVISEQFAMYRFFSQDPSDIPSTPNHSYLRHFLDPNLLFMDPKVHAMELGEDRSFLDLGESSHAFDSEDIRADFQKVITIPHMQKRLEQYVARVEQSLAEVEAEDDDFPEVFQENRKAHLRCMRDFCQCFLEQLSCTA